MFHVLVPGAVGARHEPILPAAGGRWRLRLGLVLVIAGVLTVLTAALGLTRLAAPPKAGASSSPGAGREARGAGLAIVPAEVDVEHVTYHAGQSSRWHVHNGIHVVVVMSGTLTIYDSGCQPHHYGPGDSYVGGSEAHMARNETDGAVEMVVTYVLRVGGSPADFTVPMGEPDGCRSAEPVGR